MDSSNKVIGETADQQRRAQAALKAYLDTNERYKDVATRNKDAQAELTDEVDKFRRGVGEQVNELKNLVAEGLIPVVRWLNDLPDGFKDAAAGLAVFGAPLGGLLLGLSKAAGLARTLKGGFSELGGAGVEAEAGAGALSNTVKNVLPRLKQFATGAGGSALVLGTLAYEAYRAAKASGEWVDALESADRANAALIDTQRRAIKANEDILKVRKESISQLRAEITAMADLTAARERATVAVLEAQDALSNAESTGDVEAVQAAQRRLEQARYLRKEVDQRKLAEVRAEKEVEEATRARFKQASNDYRDYKEQFDQGQFDSQKKALQAFEGIFFRLDQSGQKEAIGQLRSLRESVLSEELASLNKRLAAEKITVESAKTLQGGLLNQYKANADSRGKAEGALSETIAAVGEKRLQRTQALLQKDLDLQKAALQQRAELAKISPELTTLEQRLSKGEDVIGLIKAEANQQKVKLQGILDEEAALERIAIKREKASAVKADPTNTDTINNQAAERLRQLDAQVAADKDKLNRAVTEKNRQYEEKAAKAKQAKAKQESDQAVKTAELRRDVLETELTAQQDVFNDRKRKLQELADLGMDTAAEQARITREEGEAQLQAVQARLKAEEEVIRLRLEQANIGASKEDQALNGQKATLDLQRARRQARQDSQALIDGDIDRLRTQTAELERQRKLLEDQNAERKKAQGFNIDSDFGGVSGVADINSFGAGFGKPNLPSQRKGEDVPTAEEIDRQIRRNKILIAEKKEKSKRAVQPGQETRQGSKPPEVPKPGQTEQRAVQAPGEAGGGLSSQDSATLATMAAHIAQLPGLIQNLSAALQQQAKAANLAPNNFAASMTRRTENTLI